MGEIQAPIVVADFDNNGYCEFIACDLRGNVAVYTKDGDILWEKHLQSAISPNQARSGDRWRPFLRSRRWHALGCNSRFECGNWRGEVPFSILYGWSNLSAGCFRKSEKSFFGEFIARGLTSFDGYDIHHRR